jgi:hypothetical protein
MTTDRGINGGGESIQDGMSSYRSMLKYPLGPAIIGIFGIIGMLVNGDREGQLLGFGMAAVGSFLIIAGKLLIKETEKQQRMLTPEEKAQSQALFRQIQIRLLPLFFVIVGILKFGFLDIRLWVLTLLFVASLEVYHVLFIKKARTYTDPALNRIRISYYLVLVFTFVLVGYSGLSLFDPRLWAVNIILGILFPWAHYRLTHGT